jgi:amidophosphoribosyltransferase
VDTPERQKLLASRMKVEEMASFIKVDSLAFISLDGLYRAAGETARNQKVPQFCDACFSNEYPTVLTDQSEGGKVHKLALLAERQGR